MPRDRHRTPRFDFSAKAGSKRMPQDTRDKGECTSLAVTIARSDSGQAFSSPWKPTILNFRISVSRLALASCAAIALFTSCVKFEPAQQSTLEALDDRPSVALLPIGFDLDITSLSSVKSVDAALTPDDEATQLHEALAEICADSRWLLLSRLAAGQGFRFVPLEQTDAVAKELELRPGAVPSPYQVVEFQSRLGADLVVAVNILDYGKVRWQWFVTGAFADLTGETIALGLATAWNPIGILVNTAVTIGVNSVLFFGGGYVLGVSIRPVRVEARVFETQEGYPIWQTMEQSVYARSALKTLPEAARDRKEAQLQLNMAEIMESLGDALTKQEYVAVQFRGQPELARNTPRRFEELRN